MPMRLEADRWNRYLKALMTKLQGRARQYLFRHREDYPQQTCCLCGAADTQAFYATYDRPPVVTWFCQSCHKEADQHRGSLYDQLRRHGVPVISWEEWKSGQRPAPKAKKKPANNRYK